MNPDPRRNCCSAPEQDFERLDEMVYCGYTSGSVVWANLTVSPFVDLLGWIFC
jgi:hypothetical protein